MTADTPLPPHPDLTHPELGMEPHHMDLVHPQHRPSGRLSLGVDTASHRLIRDRPDTLVQVQVQVQAALMDRRMVSPFSFLSRVIM